MTDRYSAVVVYLDEPYRSDDMESTIEVIKHLKGVRKVEPHISDYAEVMAIDEAKRQILNQIVEILK